MLPSSTSASQLLADQSETSLQSDTASIQLFSFSLFIGISKQLRSLISRRGFLLVDLFCQPFSLDLRVVGVAITEGGEKARFPQGCILICGG